MGERGSTSCVGASVFSMKEGVCQCKVGSCSSSGQCGDGATASTSGDTIMQFELGFQQAVPRENFVLLFGGLYCFTGAVLLMSAIIISRTCRHRSSAHDLPHELLLEEELFP